jgi:hypothetical protein
MKKVMKPGVHVARQAFLYGEGDGNPVLSRARLAALAGVHESTIARHINDWIKEREEMVSNSSESALALRLSKETLDFHNSDMTHLRGLLQANKWEIDQINEITAKLERWMDKFNGDDGDQDRALRILEAWQKSCGQKSSLQSQFLALQKQWTSLSGIVDMKDVSVAQAKAMATGRAKLDLELEKNKANPRDVGMGIPSIFSRSNVLVDDI